MSQRCGQKTGQFRKERRPDALLSHDCVLPAKVHISRHLQCPGRTIVPRAHPHDLTGFVIYWVFICGFLIITTVQPGKARKLLKCIGVPYQLLFKATLKIKPVFMGEFSVLGHSGVKLSLGNKAVYLSIPATLTRDF